MTHTDPVSPGPDEHEAAAASEPATPVSSAESPDAPSQPEIAEASATTGEDAPAEENPQHTRNGRKVALLSGAVVAIIGIVLVVVGIHGQQNAPEPPLTAAKVAAQEGPGGAAPTASPSPSNTSSHTSRSAASSSAIPTYTPPPVRTVVVAKALKRSIPAAISIPSIGASSTLLRLGNNPDGSITVAAGREYNHAGWYTGSPTPGQNGPAVILGHIDGVTSGPSVFYKLGALRPGNTVKVTRGDGTVLTFVVYRAARYLKASFPIQAVYGNTPGPELRLITCGGHFDPRSGHHVDNTVIYLKEKITKATGSTKTPIA